LKTILAMILLAGVWYTASLGAENLGRGYHIYKNDTDAAAAGPSPGASAAGTEPRMLTNETRDNLIAALSEASGKQVWFVTQANDQEADSFQFELEDAFLQAGWVIASSTKSAKPLQAGLRVFVADAELPDHVSVAVGGLRGIGLDVFAGNGYRAFYDKQKEKNPKFSGVELAPDQDFMIVVGSNPPVP
jgi:hypothetical protein